MTTVCSTNFSVQHNHYIHINHRSLMFLTNTWFIPMTTGVVRLLLELSSMSMQPLYSKDVTPFGEDFNIFHFFPFKWIYILPYTGTDNSLAFWKVNVEEASVRNTTLLTLFRAAKCLQPTLFPSDVYGPPR